MKVDQHHISFKQPRLQRERKTIFSMVEIYCNTHHTQGKGKLCSDCTELMQYATRSLLHCPFQENKPTCGKCKVHCYKKDMRQKIREIMRYSGPKMITRHPIMTLFHLMDGQKRSPELYDLNRSNKESLK